jgi:signal peptidase I
LVLGDNRENSNDGRFFGPIDKKLVIGRAFVMVWPFKHVKWL